MSQTETAAYPRAPLAAPVVAPTLVDIANEAFDASQEIAQAAEAIVQANEGDRDERQALAAARAGLCSARERIDWLIAAVDAEAAPASGLRVIGSLDGVAGG